MGAGATGFVTGAAGLVARPAGRLAKPDAGGFIPPESQSEEKWLFSKVHPVV